MQGAVDEELLTRNVARLVQLRATGDRRIRSSTRAEVLRFLQAAEQHRLHALCAGDGTAAKRLDRRRLDAARLTVRQALHRVDGQLRVDPVKTELYRAPI